MVHFLHCFKSVPPVYVASLVSIAYLLAFQMTLNKESEVNTEKQGKNSQTRKQEKQSRTVKPLYGQYRSINGGDQAQTSIPCFPLASIVKAVRQDRIDFLHLGMGRYDRGSQGSVIETAPWRNLHVNTVAVHNTDGDILGQNLVRLMRQYNFTLLNKFSLPTGGKKAYVRDILFSYRRPQ